MEVVKLYLMDKLSTINGSIMPTTGTINTQQILQMGTVAEKLQHTIQHLPLTTTQQVQDDETSVNELKQVETKLHQKTYLSYINKISANQITMNKLQTAAVSGQGTVAIGTAGIRILDSSGNLRIAIGNLTRLATDHNNA